MATHEDLNSDSSHCSVCLLSKPEKQSGGSFGTAPRQSSRILVYFSKRLSPKLRWESS